MARELVKEPPLELPRRKFTVKDLDRMLEAGILGKDDKVELLEGEFIEMSPTGDPHILIVRRLARTLTLALGERAWVNAGMPIRTSRLSEPEPDISIQPPDDTGSPKLGKPYLVIEVSDTSLRKDRILKQRIYARARIPEYWIVNVGALEVEVHTKPTGNHYAKRVVHGRNAELAIPHFRDVLVRFSEIFARL